MKLWTPPAPSIIRPSRRQFVAGAAALAATSAIGLRPAMAFGSSIVQVPGASASGFGAGNSNVPLTINAAGCNFLVCVVAGLTRVDSGLFDSVNGTTGWQLDVLNNNSGLQMSIWSSRGQTYTNGMTVTYSRNSDLGYASMFSIGASGVLSSGTYVGQQSQANGVGGPIQAGSITPDNNGSLIIFGASAAAPTNTIDAPYVIDNQLPGASGVYVGGGIALNIQNLITATNPTWTSASLVGIVEYYCNSFIPPAGAFSPVMSSIQNS